MEVSAKSAAATGKVGTAEEEILPEFVAAISAAATVILGKQFRIRSLHVQHSSRESVGRWTSEGRMIVQASHNPRSKR